MNKLILTDVDGTLVDFATAFHDWMEEAGHPCNGSLHDTFEIHDVFGCDVEEANRQVELFCSSPVFAQLQPLAGSQEAVARLRAEGWGFVAITSCAASPEAVRMRRENLRRLYQIDEVIFAGLMGAKADILRRYPASIWVDDHLKHIREGIDTSHKCFVIDREYNRVSDIPQDQYVRVKDWSDIVSWIEKHGSE